jgi:hypothetical protein
MLNLSKSLNTYLSYLRSILRIDGMYWQYIFVLFKIHSKNWRQVFGKHVFCLPLTWKLQNPSIQLIGWWLKSLTNKLTNLTLINTYTNTLFYFIFRQQYCLETKICYFALQSSSGRHTHFFFSQVNI